jgi:hypothetical protein
VVNIMFIRYVCIAGSNSLQKLSHKETLHSGTTGDSGLLRCDAVTAMQCQYLCNFFHLQCKTFAAQCLLMNAVKHHKIFRA